MANTVDNTVLELGETALAAFDALQDKDPPQGDPELRRAVHHLVHLRDELIARQRAEGADCGWWLDRTNALLSGVFGAEYPVGGVPWQRIDATRDALRELIDDARATG